MSTRSTGNIGEDVACKFLEKQGFTIVERNYLKKWGELDIVARETLSREKSRTRITPAALHFFEVKSITAYWTRGTQDTFRPEDNVHALKVRHIRRTIETYLSERCRREDTPFQFHVLCVYMNMKTRKARVKWLKNVIL